MSTQDPEFLTYIRTLFQKHNSDYDILLEEALGIDKDLKSSLEETAHFYYWICFPENRENAYWREELQLIGVVSLIEKMMSIKFFGGPGKHQEPFDFIAKSINEPETLSLEALKGLREEYYAKYGSSRKVVHYFEKFMPESVVSFGQKIRNYKDIVSYLDEGPALEDRNLIAKLIYQMRNDFVHNAEMRGFCPPHCFTSLVLIGDTPYGIKANISELLDIFEESYVKFWMKNLELIRPGVVK